jgi:omega-amidase
MHAPTHPPLRLAVVQPTMHWTGDANTAETLRWLESAAAQGAQIACFPELALTGFHRQIAAQAKPELVEAWVQTIQAACQRLNIAAAIGAPSFAPGGGIYNSHLLIDAHGQLVATVPKRGLTAPEATFFAHGTTRPVGLLQGHRCSAVICREVEDLEEVCASLGDAPPEILFWPGLMGPEAGAEDEDPPRHVRQAQQVAIRTGAWLVQANWPMSLNYPELGAKTGSSVVISSVGDIVFKLPQAAVGMAVFTLGDPVFDWMAMA